MIILAGFITTLLIFLVLFWFSSNADLSYSKADAEKDLKAKREAGSPDSKAFSISSKDIETFAGDDLMTTQLDLARAYIETERRNLARNILKNVVQHGSSEQQMEAKRLLEGAAL